MRINFNSQTSFEGIYIKNKNGVKIFDDFTCRAKDGNYSMHTVTIAERERHNHNNYNINFENEELGLTATQHVALYPKSDYLFIDTMDSNYQNFGLGTCMHLINIMEMLENNINKIDLHSTFSAIPFHTRLGFQPTNKWDEGLSVNIEKIKNNDYPELKSYSESAKQLLAAKFSYPSKTILGNKLMYNYTIDAIKILPREELENLFSRATHMRLKSEDVIKNREFYNELFQKYNIDYGIDEQ